METEREKERDLLQELAHVIMEAEKSCSLLSARQRTKKTQG